MGTSSNGRAAHQDMEGSKTDQRLKREMADEAAKAVKEQISNHSIEFEEMNPPKPSKVLWAVVIILVILFLRIGTMMDNQDTYHTNEAKKTETYRKQQTEATATFRESLMAQIKASDDVALVAMLKTVLGELDDSNDNVTAFIQYLQKVGIKKASGYKEWQKSQWQIKDFNAERKRGR